MTLFDQDTVDLQEKKKVVTLEVAKTAKTNALIQIIDESGLDKKLAISIKDAFAEFYDTAQGWETKAMSIIVTDVNQVDEMLKAKNARKELRSIRLTVEERRKDLKSNITTMGRAIDHAAKMIKDTIIPLEEHLEQQEKYAKIQEEKRKEKLIEQRTAILSQFNVDCSFYNLAEMSEEQFQMLQAKEKELFEREKAFEESERKRIEAEKKAKEAEQERIRLENERLKKEQAKRESALKKKMELQFARQKKLLSVGYEYPHDNIIELSEDQFDKIYVEKEKTWRIEQERIRLEQLEREKSEREAREKAQAERKERERLEAELKAKQAAIEAENKRVQAEIAKQKAAEEAERKRIEAEKREAELAPDKEKLLKFAQVIDELKSPILTDEAAIIIINNTNELLKKVVAYVKKEIEKL